MLSPFQKNLHDSKWNRQSKVARYTRQITGFHLFRLLARILYRFRVEGEANIPAGGPCIFAMNHEAGLTDALIFLTVKRHFSNIYTFAWHQLRDESPLFNFFTTFGEHAPQERVFKAFKGRGLSGGELVRALKSLQHGEALLITVEGGITWDGRLQHPLELGAVWLALRSGAPIVPIVSIGGYDVQPYWQPADISWTGRITVRIGEPFWPAQSPVTEINQQLLNDTNEQLWQRMSDLRAEPTYTPVPGSVPNATAATASAGRGIGRDQV